MLDDPLVSILIVNWNGRKYLDSCLTSLVNQTYPNFEIILIDNASTDNSVEFVREKFPSIKIIRNTRNLGFAAASNIGVEKAKGELIALFNNDAVADKEWLNNLVRIAQSSDTIGAATGKVHYLGDKYSKDAVYCSWTKVDPYTGTVYNFCGNEPLSKVDYLIGAAMIVKKKVVEEIGTLDTRYFHYFEETDWCARMIRAGYDLIYVPNASVWHVISGSITNSELKLYYMIRNRIRFALKNFDSTYIPGFILFFLIESIYIFKNRAKHQYLTENKMKIVVVAWNLLKAVAWNLLNLNNTLKSRKKDLGMIAKNRGKILSYNRSLPLKEYKIGVIERYLGSIGKQT